MAVAPWDNDPEIGSVPAPPAAPVAQGAYGTTTVTPIQTLPPPAPTPQTPEQQRGQVLRNAQTERSLSQPIPIPGSDGWFLGPDNKPFKMDIPASSKGQQALDQKFADDYAQWRMTGQSDASKALTQLRGVAKDLETQNLTGPVIGALPDWITAFIAPEAIGKREDVEEVAQRNLRAILGGAFAAREGEMLIARAYNPRLPEAENRKRVLRLIKQMAEAAEQKESAARYFEQNGTLSGWQGKLFTSAADFDLDNDPEERRPQGDIGRADQQPPTDPRGNPLSPQQQAAYDAFLQNNPNAAPEDLIGFVRMIGGGDLDPQRAREIIDVYRETGTFAPGESAEQPAPDISDARTEEGSAGQSIDAGIRAASNSVLAGIPDRASAAANTLFGGGTYENNLAREFAITNHDWEHNTGATATGTVAGALLIPTRVTGVAQAAARTAMRNGASRQQALVAARRAAGARLAKEGGAYGTVHGAMTNQGDIADRAAEAAVSGLFGVVAGSAMPKVGQAASAAGRGIRDATTGAQGLADRIVFKAIRADGNDAATLGRQATEAGETGVPYMPADSGENARGLLSASARAPGPGRTAAVNALDARQRAFTDRMTAHIERDLGPIANPHEVRRTLETQAKTAAKPLYQATYAQPGASSFYDKVRPLFNRPSMKAALKNAHKIALEAGDDPNTLGFDFNEAGDVILREVPSWQTMDYVKRGLDDVLETFRDSTTQKLNLNTYGNEVDNTRRAFIAAFDKANPTYAAARSAWAGPVRARSALDRGLKALNKTGDDIEEDLRDMGAAEKEMYKLGIRRAMAELVDSKGGTANLVNAISGSGKKRAMLARAFGDRREFERFVRTLDVEEQAFRTFGRARTGSPTAPNLADDTQLAVSTGVADIALTGLPIISALRLASRAKQARAIENAQQAIAEMLGETNPARVRELIQRFKQAEARMIADRRGNRPAAAATRTITATAPSVPTGE